MEAFSIEIINKNSKNILTIVGDLNLNLLYYNVNAKVKPKNIPLISKPTRISKTNATTIDHINTNNYLETCIKQEY